VFKITSEDPTWLFIQQIAKPTPEGYFLAGILGAIGGSLITVLATKAIPKIMSQVMSGMMKGMMAQMGAGCADPAEILRRRKQFLISPVWCATMAGLQELPGIQSNLLAKISGGCRLFAEV
jgi:hypothetical protein